ncbi:hypothetical protein WJX73_001110 [Symbiochloris irregularis]|uniref:F-box domain-containing protein n=1 Tax=Symbiochloris irregularis TaxID=706552 RepID=A0AAW1PUX2_9CHLO
MLLLDLPEECFLHIASFLAVQDVCAAAATCRQLSAYVQDDSLWQRLAEAKWGSKVLEVTQEAPPEKWSTYCKHRMAFKSNKQSPFQLVQEQYSDPWQHLACCLMCSRTTGGAVIRQTIEDFLREYTRPTDLLCADAQGVMAQLNALGLQDVRWKALSRMSHDFLAKAWSDPSEFWGCGPFARDSWQIFCCGRTSAKGVTDVALLRYLHWLNTGATAERKPAKKRTAGVQAARGKRRPPPSASVRITRSRAKR